MSAALPCALGFAVFHSLFFLPEPQLFGSGWAILGAQDPSRPFSAAGQGSGVERLHNPPSLQLPLFPSSLPLSLPEFGRSKARSGRGELWLRVATPPEPAFSRAAPGASPLAAPLASLGAHSSSLPRRSNSATLLSELRLKPALERARCASSPAPGSLLPALGPCCWCPAPRASRPRCLLSPCPAPLLTRALCLAVCAPPTPPFLPPSVSGLLARSLALRRSKQLRRKIPETFAKS